MKRAALLVLVGALTVGGAAPAHAAGAAGSLSSPRPAAPQGPSTDDADDPDESEHRKPATTGGSDDADEQSPAEASPASAGEASDGDEQDAASAPQRDDGEGPEEPESAAGDPPFHRHWQAGLQYAREAERGGGWASEVWTASMLRVLSDEGTALGVSLGAGRTLLDGTYHRAWDLGITAALGFDRASPSIESHFGGSGPYEQHAATTIGLDLQVVDRFSLNLSAGADAHSRRDVLESFFSDTDEIAVVHGTSMTAGCGLTVEPWSWLSLSPSYEHSWNVAVAESAVRAKAPPLRERGATDMLGLSFEVTAHPLVFGVEGQVGRDQLPSDAPINPRTGLPTRAGGPSTLLVTALSLSARVDL